MDELVRISIKEIGLGGLSGIHLGEIWEHIDNEVKLRRDEIIQNELDEFIKGAIWRDLLDSPHITHYETDGNIPNEIPILDQSTIVGDKLASPEGF